LPRSSAGAGGRRRHRPTPAKEFRNDVFSKKELDYLAGRRLGSLATIDADGLPHIVPLGWTYNSALDTIDVGGRDFAKTRKFRNVKANPKVALVIDDVLPRWRPRCVMVRGAGRSSRPGRNRSLSVTRRGPWARPWANFASPLTPGMPKPRCGPWLTR
jgi:PPOX class F420-dependent enzyme/OxyR family protein